MPDDYYQKTIAGKELDFEVLMKKVEERNLPEINDAFAKTVGQFQNLAELEENIKQG